MKALQKSLFVISFIILCFLLYDCSRSKHENTRIEVDFSEPSIAISAGKHELLLGQKLFINRGFYWRDGYLYVPENYHQQPLPLVIWLHGGAGDASDADHMLSIADQYNIVILSLDSRHNTWDGIDSPFGPDVRFINKALQYVFERVSIDREKVALAGLSDGGSYSLALGRANGDFFTHLIAVAPAMWNMSPPSPAIGTPKIFLAHGVKDNVYPVMMTRELIQPRLQKLGYETEYYEFDAAHWATEEVVHKMFAWLNDK